MEPVAINCKKSKNERIHIEITDKGPEVTCYSPRNTPSDNYVTNENEGPEVTCYSPRNTPSDNYVTNENEPDDSMKFGSVEEDTESCTLENERPEVTCYSPRNTPSDNYVTNENEGIEDTCNDVSHNSSTICIPSLFLNFKDEVNNCNSWILCPPEDLIESTVEENEINARDNDPKIIYLNDLHWTMNTADFFPEFQNVKPSDADEIKLFDTDQEEEKPDNDSIINKSLQNLEIKEEEEQVTRSDVFEVLFHDEKQILTAFIDEFLAEINLEVESMNENNIFSIRDILKSVMKDLEFSENSLYEICDYLRIFKDNLEELSEFFEKYSSFDHITKQKLHSMFDYNFRKCQEFKSVDCDVFKTEEKEITQIANFKFSGYILKMLHNYLSATYSTIILKYQEANVNKITTEEKSKVDKILRGFLENIQTFFCFFCQSMLCDPQLSDYLFCALMKYMEKHILTIQHITPLMVLTLLSEYPNQSCYNLIKMFIFFKVVYDKNYYFGPIYIQNLKQFILYCILGDYHKSETRNHHFLLRKKAAKFYFIIIKKYYPTSLSVALKFFFQKLTHPSAKFYAMYGSLCVINEFDEYETVVKEISMNFKNLSSKLYNNVKHVKTYFGLRDIYKNPPPLTKDAIVSMKRKQSELHEDEPEAKKAKLDSRVTKSNQKRKGKNKGYRRKKPIKARQNKKELEENDDRLQILEPRIGKEFFYRIEQMNDYLTKKEKLDEKRKCFEKEKPGNENTNNGSVMSFEQDYKKLLQKELFDTVIKLCNKNLSLNSKHPVKNCDGQFLNSHSDALKEIMTFYGFDLIENLRFSIPLNTFKFRSAHNTSFIADLLYQLKYDAVSRFYL